MTKSVAVPSRLYYTPTEEKPLAGVSLYLSGIAICYIPSWSKTS